MPASYDTPIWADTIVRGGPDSDIEHILTALKRGEWKVEAWTPRITPAFADPTYAIAATNVDRIRNGGSAAPAASYRV
jgi:hypothetical protein